MLREAGAERITALTLSYPEEAIGIVQAAVAAGVPVVAGLHRRDRRPAARRHAAAPRRSSSVDAETGGAAEFFMVNCAHPTHIAAGLDDAPALRRIGGLRVNASASSHAELDAMEELDEGDPAALARDNASLQERLPSVAAARRLLRHRSPPRRGDRHRLGPLAASVAARPSAAPAAASTAHTHHPPGGDHSATPKNHHDPSVPTAARRAFASQATA